jgi:hypothetical protein
MRHIKTLVVAAALAAAAVPARAETLSANAVRGVAITKICLEHAPSTVPEANRQFLPKILALANPADVSAAVDREVLSIARDVEKANADFAAAGATQRTTVHEWTAMLCVTVFKG